MLSKDRSLVNRIQLSSTILLIKELHKGQVDKIGIPYWRHPYEVMYILGSDATIDEEMAALLHDAFEDTNITEEELRRFGYSEQTITILNLLTKPKDVAYFDYIQTIVDSENISAIKVKYADLVHNSLPWRVANLPLKYRYLIDRYTSAKEELEKTYMKLVKKPYMWEKN